jgi:hypothetical protein
MCQETKYPNGIPSGDHLKEVRGRDEEIDALVRN